MPSVLVVDDDPHFRGIMERVILRNHAFAVRSVATEAAAWEEMGKGPCDLVILDLYIDGKKSWDTLKRIQKGFSGPPVLMVTCEDTPENAAHAKALGAVDLIPKPIDFGRLKTAIDNLVSWEREEVVSHRLEDAGTGLYNPAHFRTRLQEEFDRSVRYDRSLALALITLVDLERAKAALAPSATERIVAEAANAIRKHTRSFDIVARTGEGDFALLMPEAGAEQVCRKVGTLRTMVEESIAPLTGEGVEVCCRIGLVSHPLGSIGRVPAESHASVEGLLDRANAALIRAKGSPDAPVVAVFDR